MAELRWRGALSGAEIADVQALVAAATDVDGTAPLSEHVLLHLRHGGDAEAAHLLARDGDELVGFAHLDLTDPVAGGAGELVVHPEHRRAGLGSRIVQALLDRAGRSEVAAGRLRLWAHGEHPGAVALATSLGFTQARVLWQMRRSLLAPLAEPHLPEGVRLRPFVVGADEPRVPARQQRRLRLAPRAGRLGPRPGEAPRSRAVVRPARASCSPSTPTTACSASTGPRCTATGRHSHEPIGEVYVLGVDPSARGMHLGAALTLAGLRHLRDRGLRQVMFYVEADNDAAVRVYRDLGFTRWDTDVSYVR